MSDFSTVVDSRLKLGWFCQKRQSNFDTQVSDFLIKMSDFSTWVDSKLKLGWFCHKRQSNFGTEVSDFLIEMSGFSTWVDSRLKLGWFCKKRQSNLDTEVSGFPIKMSDFPTCFYFGFAFRKNFEGLKISWTSVWLASRGELLRGLFLRILSIRSS